MKLSKTVPVLILPSASNISLVSALPPQSPISFIIALSKLESLSYLIKSSIPLVDILPVFGSSLCSDFIKLSNCAYISIG